MPVEELQDRMKSREFQRWAYYLRQRDKQEYLKREKWEFYFAEVILLLNQLLVKGTKRANSFSRKTRDDMLIEFTYEDGKEERREESGWSRGMRFKNMLMAPLSTMAAEIHKRKNAAHGRRR